MIGFEPFSKQLRTIFEATSNHSRSNFEPLPSNPSVFTVYNDPRLYCIVSCVVVSYCTICMSFFQIHQFFPCKMALDRPMMAPRSGQHWLKSAQVHPKTTQERPVKFRKKKNSSKTIVFLRPEWVGMPRGSSESVATTIICDAG